MEDTTSINKMKLINALLKETTSSYVVYSDDSSDSIYFDGTLYWKDFLAIAKLVNSMEKTD
jgi:hypothetical protein